MKKILAAFVLVSMFAGSLLMANVAVNKQHKTLKGKDGAKVNCAYCHTKAKIPKKKGNDINALKKGEYCSQKGCHE